MTYSSSNIGINLKINYLNTKFLAFLLLCIHAVESCTTKQFYYPTVKYGGKRHYIAAKASNADAFCATNGRSYSSSFTMWNRDDEQRIGAPFPIINLKTGSACEGSDCSAYSMIECCIANISAERKASKKSANRNTSTKDKKTTTTTTKKTTTKKKKATKTTTKKTTMIPKKRPLSPTPVKKNKPKKNTSPRPPKFRKEPKVVDKPATLPPVVLAPPKQTPVTPSPPPPPPVTPASSPTLAPAIAPTLAPLVAPTIAPAVAPTVSPDIAPTVAPTVAPVIAPAPAPSTPDEFEHCQDDQLNDNETDVDCGGLHCWSCSDGLKCILNEDCSSGICGVDSVCMPKESCSNGIQNGSETDVDCGGNCPSKCFNTKHCSFDTDCTSGFCHPTDLICAAPSCSDGFKNGLEADQDCGSNCPTKCANTLICSQHNDCASGFCHPTDLVCVAPTCSDSFKNGGELDIDCGGPDCPPCANYKKCIIDNDCESSVCHGLDLYCVPGDCRDGVLNGDETDVDCGGTICADCTATGSRCLLNTDCHDRVCDVTTDPENPSCAAPTCSDSTFNGSETDVDCGGVDCPGLCELNKKCSIDMDCLFGLVCGTSKLCEPAPTCFDGILNQGETDVDCGGPNCAACEKGKSCLADTDCLSPLLCHSGAKICETATYIGETTLNGGYDNAAECSATGDCSAFPTVGGQTQCDSTIESLACSTTYGGQWSCDQDTLSGGPRCMCGDNKLRCTAKTGAAKYVNEGACVDSFKECIVSSKGVCKTPGQFCTNGYGTVLRVCQADGSCGNCDDATNACAGSETGQFTCSNSYTGGKSCIRQCSTANAGAQPYAGVVIPDETSSVEVPILQSRHCMSGGMQCYTHVKGKTTHQLCMPSTPLRTSADCIAGGICPYA